jgi:hypothetical protein
MYPILNAEMPSPEAHMFLDELAEGRIILGSLAVSEAAALFMPEYPRLQPLLYGDAVRLRHTVEHQRDGEPGSMNGYYTAVQEVPDAQGAHAILLLPTPEHLPAA